jgi:hypothetical protein
MSNTITVRLPEDLADWLDSASRRAGVPRGRIVRDQLELARKREKRPFLRLAGSVEGPRGLSTRKGFSRDVTRRSREAVALVSKGDRGSHHRYEFQPGDLARSVERLRDQEPVLRLYVLTGAVRGAMRHRPGYRAPN